MFWLDFRYIEEHLSYRNEQTLELTRYAGSASELHQTNIRSTHVRT